MVMVTGDSGGGGGSSSSDIKVGGIVFTSKGAFSVNPFTGARTKISRPRGGGGVVGVSAPGVDPAKEAERRLAEQKEAERKIEEQIRQQEARDLAEQQRQEKIRSGTLVGQFEVAAKPSQVGLPTDQQRFTTLSFAEATVASGKRFFQRLVSPPGGERPSFGSILDPFDRTVLPKAGEEVLIIDGQPVGTERFTGLQKRAAEAAGIELTTFGELQKEIEAGRIEDISKEKVRLEEQLGSGEIEFEEAEKQFKGFQEDVFKTTPDIPGIREPPRSPVRGLVELAAFATPLTSFVAAQVSAQADPLKIDIKEIEKGTTIEGSLIQRPSLRTGTFLVGGVIGGATLLARGGKAVTTADIEESVLQAQLAQKGVRIPGTKGFIDLSFGAAASGDVKAVQASITASKVIDATTIKTIGETQTLVLGKTFFAEKPFVSTVVQDISATTKFLPGTGKLSIGVSKVSFKPKVGFAATPTKKGFIGEVRTFEGAEVQTQRTLGFGFKKEDIIFSTGGRISEISLDQVIGRGFVATKGIIIKAPKETQAALKIFKPKTDVGITSFRGGRRTPFSTTFGKAEQLQTIPIQKSIVPVTPVRAVTKTEPIGFGLPRSVGGTGLIEAQLETKIVPTTFTLQPSRVKLVFDQGLVSTTFQPPGARSILGLGLTQKQFPATTQALESFSIQVPKPALRQKTLLEQSLKEPLFTGGRFGFRPISGFGGVPFFLPPFPILGGTDRPRKKKKRARPKVPIRPSLTGIIFEIQEAAIITPGFGVLPGQIRGLATGFETPKKKKKVKKKKSK